MIFTMSSKIFQDIFLNNETDDDILNTQYVIVSSRIRKKGSKNRKNIIIANALLYPNSDVYAETLEGRMIDRYQDQLEDALPLFASLIKGSIEEGFNIVFLCTKKEYKHMPYLDWLAYYVYDKIGYPIYEYLSFVAGCKMLKYDKKKVIKKCNKILKEASDKKYLKNMMTPQGREIIRKEIDQMDKKELKKRVKKMGFDPKFLTKEQMRDILKEYM